VSEAPVDVRVWDLPTRVFHWLLVALVGLQWASGEFRLLPMQWHYRLGYATLALVVFRVAWGFAGSDTSRFAQFVRGPGAVLRHLASVFRGERVRHAGHNPLGGWSVLLMLASIALQAVSGLFTSDDISEEGPLVAHVATATVHGMTRIHHLCPTVLLVLIVLHVAAVLGHRVFGGDDLITPMLHGRARLEHPPRLRFAPTWLALLLLAASAAAVWTLLAVF